MSKTEHCIKLLELLNTGRTYKVSELASLLETNPRNIVEYKKELELCGYNILSTSGRYGGYYIDTNNLIPTLKLNKKEKDSIIESLNFCLSKKDFQNKQNLIYAYSKISSRLDLDEYNKKLYVVDHYQLTMNESDINKRYLFIEDAINNLTQVELLYESLKYGTKTHIVNPYKLFIYNNSWFFLGLDLEAEDVRTFKVNRIKEYKKLNKKFIIPKNFNPEDYFDSQGFKNNGDFIHVKLKVKGVRRQLLKERVYGKNQNVVDIDDTYSIAELDMQNEEQVIQQLLSYGTDLEILEPRDLIVKFKNILKEMSQIYEGSDDS